MRPGVVLQHGEGGPPGRFADWLDARGLAYSVHRSWEQSPALHPDDYGFVSVLGSEHSVNDTQPDWIEPELDFVRRAVAAGVPVLGLCWGGQALAKVMGATVGPAKHKERGWLAIDSDDPEIATGPWALYHTEIFTVPAGAAELARTPVGPAAFRHGPHLGLQFHPEVDAAIMAGWAAKDATQTEAGRAQLAAEGARFSAGALPLSFALFDAWWAQTGAATLR